MSTRLPAQSPPAPRRGRPRKTAVAAPNAPSSAPLSLHQVFLADIGDCHPAALPVAHIVAESAPTFRTLQPFPDLTPADLSAAAPVILVRVRRNLRVIGGFRTLNLAKVTLASPDQWVWAHIYNNLTDHEICRIAVDNTRAHLIVAQFDRQSEPNAELLKLLMALEKLRPGYAADRRTTGAKRQARATGLNASRLRRPRRGSTQKGGATR